jgi:hypothetical protein
MKTALLVILLSGTGLDLTSTLIKLHQGCVEANPLLTSVHLTTGPRLAIFKGGMMVGLTIGFERLYPAHPKFERTLAAFAGGAGFVAGLHNLNTRCR